jgi:hypothetical protein
MGNLEKMKKFLGMCPPTIVIFIYHLTQEKATGCPWSHPISVTPAYHVVESDAYHLVWLLIWTWLCLGITSTGLDPGLVS